MPYQVGQPGAGAAISARGWVLLLLSVAVGFAVVSLAPPRVFAGILSVVWSPPAAAGPGSGPDAARPTPPAQLGLRAADHVWVVRAEPVSA